MFLPNLCALNTGAPYQDNVEKDERKEYKDGIWEPGKFLVDNIYATELRKAVDAAQEAAQASGEPVRISDDVLQNLFKAAIELWRAEGASNFGKFHRTFHPVEKFLDSNGTIQDASKALLDAMLPFDITDAISAIMAFKWLNLRDRFPELKSGEGQRKVVFMVGFIGKKEDRNMLLAELEKV